jgi:hypothetical protein
VNTNPTSWQTGIASLTTHATDTTIPTSHGYTIQLAATVNTDYIQATEQANPQTIWLFDASPLRDTDYGNKQPRFRITASFANRKWSLGPTERFTIIKFNKALTVAQCPVYLDLGPHHSIGLQPSKNDKDGVCLPPLPLRDRIVRVYSWPTNDVAHFSRDTYWDDIKKNAGACAFLTIPEFFQSLGIEFKPIPDFQPRTKRKDWQVWTTRGYPAWEAPPETRTLTPEEHARKMLELHKDIL